MNNRAGAQSVTCVTVLGHGYALGTPRERIRDETWVR